ncbi:MAG TPA: CDP-alcohol phosphatidyltransferase family protein [Candidatus Saccharimonadales bacterium]|nr:CDP-alcohol phosphatidyltransferase family protein [Candidatus Saccharimonadales bacterium]
MAIQWHLATTAPEWAHVPSKKRTPWQRLATQTHGIVTPGNIVSVVGILLVFMGLAAIWFEHYWLSLILLAIGRLCDIADGAVAHKTATKSPLGEGMDATCDKIGALATLTVYAAVGFLWWPAALLIGLQNLINSLIGLIGRQRQYGLHPLPVGKVSTAGEWLALLGLGLIAALGWSQTSTLGYISYGLLYVSLAFGGYATLWYIRLFWATKRRSGLGGKVL